MTIVKIKSEFIARVAARARCYRWAWRLLGAVAVLVLGAEIVLRTGYSERLGLRAAPAIYEPHDKYGFTYIRGTASSICLPGACREVRIDSDGLVGGQHPKEKKEGIFRIAILDGSEGTGIFLADNASAYVDRLERLLTEEGLAVEVINFSRDGVNRAYEDAQFALDVVPAYSPDLLILQTSVPFVHCNVKRDLYRGYVVSYSGELPFAYDDIKRRIDYIEDHQFAIGLYDASYIVRQSAFDYVRSSASWRVAYVQAFIDKWVTGRYRLTPISMKRSLDVLVDVKDVLAANGGKLLLRTNEPLPAEALSRGLQFSLTEAIADEGLWYNGHLTDAGHGRVAEELASVVRPYLNTRADKQNAGSKLILE